MSTIQSNAISSSPLEMNTNMWRTVAQYMIQTAQVATALFSIKGELLTANDLWQCSSLGISQDDLRAMESVPVEFEGQTVAVLYQQALTTEDGSLYDSLTSLLNRRGLAVRFQHWRETLSDSSLMAGTLVFCDIQKFKSVNDQLGHKAGDEVLTTLAGWLRETFRQTDMIVRYGGDEFLVFCPNCSSQTVEKRMKSLNDRIATSLKSGEMSLAGQIFIFATATISANTSLDEAIEMADQNFYRKKQR